MEGNAVVDNYRPPQGLNERAVYHHDVNIELALAAPCTDLGLGENCSISEDLCCPGTSCQEVVWGDYWVRRPVVDLRCAVFVLKIEPSKVCFTEYVDQDLL